MPLELVVLAGLLLIGGLVSSLRRDRPISLRDLDHQPPDRRQRQSSSGGETRLDCSDDAAEDDGAAEAGSAETGGGDGGGAEAGDGGGGDGGGAE